MMFFTKKKAEPIANHPGIAAAQEYDDLLSRVIDGGTQPGDAMDAQARPVLRADLDRIKGVRIRMKNAGNAQEWSEAVGVSDAAERRMNEVTAANEPRINTLQAELDKLRAEVAKARGAAKSAAAIVATMTQNCDMLQSEMLLPPVINQEIANQINRSGDRAEWNRISREINKHRSNGHTDALEESQKELAQLEASWPAAIKQDLATLRGFYSSQIR